MTARTRRILIIGRTPSVLAEAVALLRERGYAANASNQFDTVLDDYDVREVDLVLLGGAVPPETKDRLTTEAGRLHPELQVVQGLGGIPPLLVAQVEELFGGGVPDLEYVAAARTLRLTLPAPTRVRVEGLWADVVDYAPVTRSTEVLDRELAAGEHTIPVPDAVPVEGSYLTVRAGDRVSALRIGDTPQQVTQLVAAGPLPDPEPLTTRDPWE